MNSVSTSIINLNIFQDKKDCKNIFTLTQISSVTINLQKLQYEIDIPVTVLIYFDTNNLNRKDFIGYIYWLNRLYLNI